MWVFVGISEFYATISADITLCLGPSTYALQAWMIVGGPLVMCSIWLEFLAHLLINWAPISIYVNLL